jgi:hypothetical protein
MPGIYRLQTGVILASVLLVLMNLCVPPAFRKLTTRNDDRTDYSSRFLNLASSDVKLSDGVLSAN